MSKVTVRSAKHEDVGVIAEIIRKLGWFKHVNEESPAATERRVLLHLELCDADDSHTVLVAEDEEGVVSGYISVHWLPYLMLAGPEGYISELFVHEDARGKGVGTALINDIKEYGITKGCSRLMTLNGRDRPSYEREFYTALGFEERSQMAMMVLSLKES
ncbi:MAG: GNAT family N-acetyltransferase [Actinobacteria bacterium]|nr:GNAT family N-acetyltransferase [Actinomycetota bacterium]MBU1945011.1 GNAT family N-acetyltransferase [Actinomycetota bacterium]MBU2686653.1 GNAT family N-acetyltransferase [Actinomycetota bacterium]